MVDNLGESGHTCPTGPVDILQGIDVRNASGELYECPQQVAHQAERHAPGVYDIDVVPQVGEALKG